LEKKIYLSIAFCCVLVTGGFCQKTRTLFYDDILYGKVQKVATAYYIPGTPGVDLTDTTLYDKKGNTVETRRRTRHGAFFDDKYIDKSDASGKKMKMTGNEKGQEFNLKFDSNGNLVEYDSHLTTGEWNFKSTYTYDQRNNLASFQFFDKNNKLVRKRTYKYNSKDLLMEEDNWEEDPKLRYHLEFTYVSFDKAGNWTKRTSNKKTADGKVVPDVVILTKQ
jgi:hypothetical protein